jgi:hypothetical protein
VLAIALILWHTLDTTSLDTAVKKLAETAEERVLVLDLRVVDDSVAVLRSGLEVVGSVAVLGLLVVFVVFHVDGGVRPVARWGEQK